MAATISSTPRVQPPSPRRSGFGGVVQVKGRWDRKSTSHGHPAQSLSYLNCLLLFFASSVCLDALSRAVHAAI